MGIGIFLILVVIIACVFSYHQGKCVKIEEYEERIALLRDNRLNCIDMVKKTEAHCQQQMEPEIKRRVEDYLRGIKIPE